MVDNSDLLKAIESIRTDIVTNTKHLEVVRKDLQDVKQSQAHSDTALEAIAAGQKEIQETMATKADIQDLQAGLTKKVKGHERRINTIEDELDIPHPDKN
jgi:predicted  nucleic acid-binding Zn-ribbon protein